MLGFTSLGDAKHAVTGKLYCLVWSAKRTACVQLHASQESEAGCNAQGRLQIRQQDLISIFVTSTAEMPGMLFASLLVDVIGRKR